MELQYVLMRFLGCHECVGFCGSQFGCRLTIERILHIVRYPGSIGSNRRIVSKLKYVGSRIGVSDVPIQ
ncbi:unnamed protein product [Prunus armeniaca]